MHIVLVICSYDQRLVFRGNNKTVHRDLMHFVEVLDDGGGQVEEAPFALVLVAVVHEYERSADHQPLLQPTVPSPHLHQGHVPSARHHWADADLSDLRKI